MEIITIQNSSNIDSIGYSSKNKELFVKFLNGKVFKYDGVVLGVYEGITKAVSAGRYFNSYIKPRYHGKYVGNVIVETVDGGE